MTATEDRLFLQDREGTVYALRREDGALVWTRQTGPDLPLSWGWDYVGPTPVLAGGSLEPGASRPGASEPAVSEPAATASGWPGTGSSDPGIARALLLVACGDGVLRALSPETGDDLWRFDTGARLRATPVVGGPDGPDAAPGSVLGR